MDRKSRLSYQSYTRSSDNWTSSLDTNISSWFTPTNTAWLLSSSAENGIFGTCVYSNGYFSSNVLTYYEAYEIHPTINLKSETVI